MTSPPESTPEDSQTPVSTQASEPGGGEQVGLDGRLASLRQIVESLEQGSLPLEQQLARFEEGVRLARQASALLDAAERRVDVLIHPPEGDLPARTAPFERST